MRRMIPGMLWAFLFAATLFVSGCETFKGTGRDISNLGKLISGD